MKKFTFLNFLNNGLRFGNVVNIKETLSFTGQSINIPGSVNGRKVQTVQNTVSYNAPISVLPEGCTDQCMALPATVAIRVSISAPASVSTETKAAWEEFKTLVDNAIANDHLLEGFKPAASNNITIGE